MSAPPLGHNSSSIDAMHDMMADALAQQGWCLVQNYFAPEMLIALRQRLEVLHHKDRLTPAGIGRGVNNNENKSIRRDLTEWLSHSDPTESELLTAMEQLRLALNQRLLLGLFYYEAHFALYEPNAFYKRHLDAFKGEKNRIISTVLYLNPEWREEDGGMLALYEDEYTPEAFLKVAPEMGSLILFFSEDIPHEVLPSYVERASIAGWFRCNDRGPNPALQSPLPTSA